MKRSLLTLLLTIVPFLLTAREEQPIRVACIGDSITYGMKLEDRDSECYPSQLQAMLGNGYVVGNFGKNGATLLRHGHRPYMDQEEFTAAMQFPADVIVIHLGVNDTDPRNWPNYRDEFVGDYLTLIDTLKTVSPGARVIVALTSPIADRHPRFQSGTKEWQEEIQDAIRTVAAASGADLIDFHTPLYPYPQHIPDAVHPDAWGAALIAKTVYGAITGDYGGLSLPALYTDHMVLQRGVPLDIHGRADTGEKVTVRLGKEKLEAEGDVNGRWCVTFPAREAATGLTLTVSTKARKLVLEDVAIGEVWLCSGQSNMEFMMYQSTGTAEDIAAAADDGLRLFDMKCRWRTDNIAWSVEAIDSLNNLQYFKETVWEKAAPENVRNFSAVGYYFGRKMREELGVPVGLICNAVGGSTTEAWIDRNTLETRFPKILENWTMNDFIQDWARGRALKNLQNRTDRTDRHPYQPCYLFEAGILPLEQYRLRGVIWYQGESNAHNKSAHERLFTLLADSWRAWFRDADLPIYYVQLSSLGRPSWPWFRDSQRQLMKARKHLGMAVTSDIGDPYDVHYKNKKPVGGRLARWALHNDYGRTNVVPSGPLFRSARASEGRLVVSFDYGDGLHAGALPSGEAVDAPLTGFEIAEFDGCFYPAKAEITGNEVVLSAPEVARPALVRYGWEPYTRANLYNGAGLPASTFRGEADRPAPAPGPPSFAADVLEVRETRIPVLVERQDNEVFLLRITPDKVRSLDRITLAFGDGVNLNTIRRVKLYYGGTDTRTYNRTAAFAPTEYMTAFDPGKTLSANPSYSMLLSQTGKISRTLTLEASKPLFPGVNYFWVSIGMNGGKTGLADSFTAQITSALADGKPLEVKTVSPEGIVHRMGVGVRHAGDDGVAAYRIPGLVTSRKGTLVATYDIRYNHSRDLQEYIDIGVSRSTDGGRTWEKMRKAVAMGEAKGLPLAQNGAGDAAILSDDVNGNLWIATIWAHGMGRTPSWWSTTPGLDPERTAQLVVSCSKDDGRTWSAPRSITPQLKDPAWAFFFDGPGRGITTSDGKLVFASQYTDFDKGRTPHAGIIYSEDRGETWHIHTAAKDSTTEAQVAELPDGALMLNMRDNRGGARSVAVTRDMGRTWEEHPSSRSALREPVCMASLISVRAGDNVLGRDILLFSNPDDSKARRNITIKASLDGGLTWNEGVLLDEREGWGYSCLTMIDDRTVGILYESSVANMTFQAIPLADIVR